jgi:C4-dicarboxylate-specific signal transduction histidine kinase
MATARAIEHDIGGTVLIRAKNVQIGYRPQSQSAQRCGSVADAGMNRLSLVVEDLAQRVPPALQLPARALLVGVVCSLSTELGFALKFPPHHISPLWPTGAILFSVLVMTSVRHWWVYIVAAYFTSVVIDARAGFPIWALLYIAAGLVDVLIAAAGVRHFAGGVRAFDSLRNVLLYVLIAVVLAPFLSAFVGAFAGAEEDYWFYWRVWFLSEALAYLTLAPAILACVSAARREGRHVPWERAIEAGMIAGGLLLVSIRAFFWPDGSEGYVPALVYLPLPFLLWAAVRFGPAGATVGLLFVALASISASVQGRGPFTTGTTVENVISLQLFLFALSLPLIFLAALVAERRERANVLRESEARFRSLADDAQRHRAQVDEALAFEHLVAGVLATLLLAPKRDEDRVIERGLGDVARHLGVEGAVLWERVPEAAEFRATHRWLGDNFPAPPDRLGAPELPWISAQLLSGSVVRLGRWTGLPGEATQDLAALQRLGVRSLLAVPFSISGEVAGVLSFASTQGDHTWPESLLSRVTILAEVFAGVHARRAVERRERAAQAEAAQFRERLAHLVRVHTMGEMSAAIAHEINQPLMAITNYTQAARRRLADANVDSDKLSDLLTKVAAQSARAGDVVRRVAGMVKRQETEPRELDLGQLIASAVELVRQELELHDVRVELHLARGLPAVRGDDIQLQQVMLNLMRNAMDAMEAVSVSGDRTLSIGATANDQGEVDVRVCDRGPGICSDDAERVFDPFYSTKASGLGIGLAICRNIVEAHGGRIEARPSPLGGVWIHVELPLTGEEG